jgi:hypothetical protein
MEIFELFLKIPIFETNGNSVYYKLEQGGIANVATSIARRDHRKSKFGLRHVVKLY